MGTWSSKRRLFICAIAASVIGANSVAVAEVVDTAAFERSVVRVVDWSESKPVAGTGFVVSNRGHIATNAHVIRSGDDIVVWVAGVEHEIPAKVVWSSAESDIAILHAPAVKVPALSLTRADLPKLSQVIAMGYPGVVDRMVDGDDVFVTSGEVARYASALWVDGGKPVNTVLHTAQLSPGNSGGPLLDTCGRVVGINTRVHSEKKTLARINLASRTSHLMDALDRLRIEYTEDRTPCMVHPLIAKAPESRDAVPRRADAAREAEAGKSDAEGAKARIDRAEPAEARARQERRRTEELARALEQERQRQQQERCEAASTRWVRRAERMETGEIGVVYTNDDVPHKARDKVKKDFPADAAWCSEWFYNPQIFGNVQQLRAVPKVQCDLVNCALVDLPRLTPEDQMCYSCEISYKVTCEFDERVDVAPPECRR